MLCGTARECAKADEAPEDGRPCTQRTAVAGGQCVSPVALGGATEVGRANVV